MKQLFILSLSILSILFSCKEVQEAPTDKSSKIDTDTLISEKISPVFGYRFALVGDFNGDNKQDTLKEYFFSERDQKETNKFYGTDAKFEVFVDSTISKQPYSFMTCDNCAIDTLRIAKTGQLLGVSYIKNEGDLNGDGTDEVSYVVNWADWSSTNTCHLMTYKQGKWKELYAFGIWDWQLPNLPNAISQYGLFGLDNIKINTENDTLSQRQEKELLAFEGFITKIKNNHIRVRFRNDEAMEDTAVVDLKNIDDAKF